MVKGRNFEASVAFTTGFTEVVENPQDYEGVLVFRDYQKAGAPVYLTLRADIEAVDPDVPAGMTFVATPTQTAALPDWDHVAYCDLQTKTGSGSIQRLFDAEVCVNE